MGITRLMNLIKDKCPNAIKHLDLKNYNGKSIACDASMAIYQFIISTQHIKKGLEFSELKDRDGNLTGHLLGIFNRSVIFLENGINPCWIFDGKPPDAKLKLISERKVKKNVAEENKFKAIEENNFQNILKYANQSVKITPTMTQDAKKLVRLLGFPLIEAPSEAEAQCSVLVKSGKLFGTASEDMDCLTFGCPVLLRGFTNKNDPVIEIKLELVLQDLELNMNQFIDLCILSGCDYCDNIDGIGSIKGLKLIKEYNNIEGVLNYLEKYNCDLKKKKKYIFPKENFNYNEARNLFSNPDVLEPDEVELNWIKPDFDGLRDFLCYDKGFGGSRIDKAIIRIEVI